MFNLLLFLKCQHCKLTNKNLKHPSDVPNFVEVREYCYVVAGTLKREKKKTQRILNLDMIYYVYLSDG
jgi:hypothetical protein